MVEGIPIDFRKGQKQKLGRGTALDLSVSVCLEQVGVSLSFLIL